MQLQLIMVWKVKLCGNFYVEIVAFGDDGSIGIGLVPFDYPFGNQPGWKDGSIGYHADDGG